MSDKVQCPICGGMFDSDQMEYLDNGNTACSECVQKENELLYAEKE